jgi:hypothetical protein
MGLCRALGRRRRVLSSAGATPATSLLMIRPGGRMADYIATAICEGDYWVIDVPGVGTTRTDSVDGIEETAVDLVSAMTHTAPREVHVQVRIV